MASSPQWLGSTDLTEQVESQEIETSANDQMITLVFIGPYNTCKSQQPQIGNLVTQASNLPVERVKVTRMSGGRGKLTITCRRLIASTAGTVLSDQVQEEEQVRIEKPLAQHPQFTSLTPQDIANAKAWAENPATYTGPAISSTGNSALYNYAIRLARGQDTYVVYGPVLRRTTEYLGPPQTGGCGQIADPPFAGPTGAWVYMKTADTARRQSGRTSRIEEWTGADAIDTYIYGPSSGLPH